MRSGSRAGAGAPGHVHAGRVGDLRAAEGAELLDLEGGGDAWAALTLDMRHPHVGQALRTHSVQSFAVASFQVMHIATDFSTNALRPCSTYGLSWGTCNLVLTLLIRHF